MIASSTGRGPCSHSSWPSFDSTLSQAKVVCAVDGVATRSVRAERGPDSSPVQLNSALMFSSGKLNLTPRDPLGGGFAGEMILIVVDLGGGEGIGVRVSGIVNVVGEGVGMVTAGAQTRGRGRRIQRMSWPVYE
jgi:hypothetical protein